MNNTEPRIDAYIEKAKPFAQPILKHLREVIHKACPMVEEKIKWSFPCFDYKGEMMCHMALFKEHMAFGFWKAAIMNDPEQLFMAANDAMGSLGRITSIKDLPSDKVLKAYIKEAMRLNDEKIKLPVANKAKGKSAGMETPGYVTELLEDHPKAKEQWHAFAPSHRKEYLEWITEAKTEATRDKRLATMIEWLTEGKSRHWKYK